PAYSAAYEAKQQWGIGGDYSRALQAVTTALVGSVAGQGARQVATNALAPYAAQLIGKTFDQNHGSDPNAVLQGLSHAVLGAVLAQVNGTSMAGGALAGAGGELAAQYLTKTLYGNDPQAYGPDGKFDPNRLPEADKQMLMALSQAVGAIAGGMTGGSLGEAAEGAQIAGNAVINNRMLRNSEIDKIKELSGGDPEKELQLTLAACAEVECSSQYPVGSDSFNFYSILELEGGKDEYAQERELLSSQFSQITRNDEFGVPYKISEKIFGYTLADQWGDSASVWNSVNGNLLGRAIGAVQAASGGTAATIGLSTCAETFGLGCLAAAWGVDQFQAGIRYTDSGVVANTIGGTLLSKAGLSNSTAETLYGLAGAALSAGNLKLMAGLVEVAPGKFDYIFGRVASNPHNAARSNQLAFEMKRLGIHDNAAGRQMLNEHLSNAVKSEGNIVDRLSNEYGKYEVRESLFVGPSGKAVNLRSTFQIMDNGTRRLSTIIPRN
ncbi:VENN motif pre-toxin domain-containing protein, partial [Xanthomonas arboricola]|uniref:VENN motif pre-toxin domain-containing protein n=1 Tax=Xanthomonas arboricola TaxID=56448 RepID=UPI00137A510D